MRRIYRVKLFGEERGYLEELLRVGKAAARTLMHARILLKADEGPGGPAWGDDQIVEALEVSRSTWSGCGQGVWKKGPTPRSARDRRASSACGSWMGPWKRT
jgi:hypothetical protein